MRAEADKPWLTPVPTIKRRLQSRRPGSTPARAEGRRWCLRGILYLVGAGRSQDPGDVVAALGTTPRRLCLSRNGGVGL